MEPTLPTVADLERFRDRLKELACVLFLAPACGSMRLAAMTHQMLLGIEESGRDPAEVLFTETC